MAALCRAQPPPNKRRATTSNRTKKLADARNIVMVPLGKLKKSPKNMRKVPHNPAEIDALAASITALGMLQFPVIEPELGPKDKPTGNYLVNAVRDVASRSYFASSARKSRRTSQSPAF